MTTPAQSILFEKVVVRHGKMGKAKLRPSLAWQSRARGALGTSALPGFLAQASPVVGRIRWTSVQHTSKRF